MKTVTLSEKLDNILGNLMDGRTNAEGVLRVLPELIRQAEQLEEPAGQFASGAASKGVDGKVLTDEGLEEAADRCFGAWMSTFRSEGLKTLELRGFNTVISYLKFALKFARDNGYLSPVSSAVVDAGKELVRCAKGEHYYIAGRHMQCDLCNAIAAWDQALSSLPQEHQQEEKGDLGDASKTRPALSAVSPPPHTGQPVAEDAAAIAIAPSHELLNALYTYAIHTDECPAPPAPCTCGLTELFEKYPEP